MARFGEVNTIYRAPKEQAPDSSSNEYSTIERVGHTLGDFFGNIGAGIVKGFEGMTDYFGGLFGADKDKIAYDWTYNHIGKHLADNLKGSYMNGSKAGETARSVAFGLGNMLPAVSANALNLVVPGAGTALSAGMFMTGAGGQGVEKAYQDGATYGKAMTYGTVSGLIEGGVEAISGGIGGIGKNIAKSTAKSLGKSTVKSAVKGGAKKFAKNMVGEGVEEVASDLLDPLASSIYKGKVDYSGVTPGSLLNTFATGALVGGVMQGGQKIAVNSSKKLYTSDKLAQVDGIRRSLDTEYNNGKLTPEQYSQGMSDVELLKGMIIKKYDKSGERGKSAIENTIEKRGGVENFGLGLDSQPTLDVQELNNTQINQGELVKLDETQFVQSTSQELSKKLVSNVKDTTYDYAAYSPSLVGQEDKLIYKPTSAAITAEEKSEIASASKLLNSNGTKLVITDDIPIGKSSANGAYKDGVLYIRRGSDAIAETVKHEFTHGIEGTKAYAKFARYVASTIAKDPELTKRYGNVTDSAGEILKSYEGQSVELDGASAVKETIAKYVSEKLFTDPKQISRLVRSNRNFGGRVLGYIQNAISRLSQGKKESDTKSLSFLKNAEKLYAKAMRKSEAGGNIQRSNGRLNEKASNESVAKNGIVALSDGVRYNIEKTFSEQVDEALKSESQNNYDYSVSHLKLSNTPKVLTDLGYRSLPLLMTKKHLITMTNDSGTYTGNYHGLGADLVKSLPRLIESPIAVFKSMTKADSVVMVLDAKDSEGRQLIAAIKKDGLGKFNNFYIDANILTSGYGRNNFTKFVEDNVNASNVLIYDKEKGKNIFAIPQLQLLSDKNVPFLTNSISNPAKKSNSLAETSLKNNKNDTKPPQFSLPTEKNIPIATKAEEKTKENADTKVESKTKDGGGKKPPNISKLKVYSKDDAKSVVDRAMAHMTFGDKYGELPSEAKRQALNMIWDGLNNSDSKSQGKTALEIAEYIINNAVVDSVYDNNDTSVEKDTIKQLKPYMHAIDISNLQGDIAHKYGKDRGIYARWGKRKDIQGYGADQVGQLLEASGMHINATSEADILFEIDNAYTKAVDAIKKQDKSPIASIVSQSELNQAKQDIAREILLAYDEQGSLTATAQKINKLESSNAALKRENREQLDKLDKATTALNSELNRNNTKAITLVDCGKVISYVMDEIYPSGRLEIDDKSEIARKLYKQLNNETIDRSVPAKTVAKWIIENAYLREYDVDANENAIDIEEFYNSRIADKFNLSSIEGEVSEVFGKKAYQKITNAEGMDISKITEYIPAVKDLGITIDENSTPAETFIAIHASYKDALDVQKGKVTRLKDFQNTAQYTELLNNLTASLTEAFAKYSSDTPLYKEVNTLQKSIAELKKLNNNQKDSIKEEKLISKYTNKILDHTRLFRDMKKKGISADIPKDSVLDKMLSVLGRIVMRGSINRANAKVAVTCLKAFYTPERIGIDTDTELISMIGELDTILSGADLRVNKMDVHMLELFDKVLGGVRAYIRNADNIVRDGVNMSARAEAQKGIDILRENKRISMQHKVYGSEITILRKSIKILDPSAVFALADGNHKNGVLTWLFNGLKKAESAQKALLTNLLVPTDELFEKKPKLKKQLQADYELGGVTITREHAISVYLTSKRNQAEGALFGVDKDGKHYEGGGFRFVDDKGKTYDITVSREDLKKIKESLTADELEYIKLAEEFFNVNARNVKYEADHELMGYSNVMDTYYFPIARDDGDIAKRYADAKEYVVDFQNIYSFSMNHDVTENARNAIKLLGLSDIIADHAQKVSTYATMTEAMRSFDKVMNANVNKGDPTALILTFRSVLDKEMPMMNKYILDLMQDLQGAGRQRTSRVLSKMRNGFIKFQLGANPKTWLSQWAGLPAALTYLSPVSLAKGCFTGFDEKMYKKYSAYGAAREYNRTIVRAEGLSGKIGKVGDFAMKPIQANDNWMMHGIWNACRVEVAKKQGLAIDTEVNYIAAAELYETVSRKTQSNDAMSEKSALQRSESEIVRSIASMFKSDAVKQISRIVEHFSALLMTKIRVKEGLATKAELNKARGQLVRTAVAYTLSNAMYVAIGLLFNCMLRKRDEEGKPWDGNDYGKAFGMGMLESFLGLFPLVGDIYNSVTTGYDIEHFSYSMLNDLVNGTKGVLTLVDKGIKGESITESDGLKAMRNIIYPIGMFFGIPIRNLVKYPKMIVNWISPSAVYKYDSLFYPQHTKSLNAAVAQNDEKLGKTVLNTMLLRDKCGEDLTATATDEMYRLYALTAKDREVGFALPSSVPRSITYIDKDDKEAEITLTSKQHKEFASTYSNVSVSVNKLITSAEYKRASDKDKSKMLRNLYSYYYDSAKSELTGINKQASKSSLVKIMGSDIAVTIMSQLQAIEPDKFANGKVKPDSRKRKIMAVLSKYSLTATQREYFLVACGYAPRSKKSFASRVNSSPLSPDEKQYYLDKCD